MTLASPDRVSNLANAPVVPRAESSVDSLDWPAIHPAAVEVHEINDPSALEPHATDWNELLLATPGASYFHSYDWFATYWRHFGAEQRMRVLLVFDDERLAGIVPLVVTRERTKLGSLRSLRYPLHGWGSFFGPIGADSRLLLRYALKHVLTTRRDWDLLDLLWVDRDGADGGATAAAAADLQMSVRATPWLASAQINIAGGWDSYWSSRKSHFRTNVRRDERRLGEKGGVRFVRHRPAGAAHGCDDPRWDLYDECERIAASSWQGTSTTGTTLSHESIRDFLRDAHRVAAVFGGVDMNLLLLEGRPVAFAYNYHSGGYVYGLRAGFDAAAVGAGTVLQRMMIEDSCLRGDRLIDLGPGSSESKRHWQTRTAVAWRYTHYARGSPRAQLLNVLHALKPQCSGNDCQSRP
jgi:CelD/BcsL family acetyltransferase involved in cellulose biosynthesis